MNECQKVEINSIEDSSRYADKKKKLLKANIHAGLLLDNHQ